MSEFRHPVFKGKKYPEIRSNIDCDEFSLTSVQLEKQSYFSFWNINLHFIDPHELGFPKFT